MQPIVVQQGDARVEVKATTPRISMTYKTLAIRMASFYKDLAVELGIMEGYLDNALSDFASFSAYVSKAEGLDFELATLGDGEPELRRKFLTYMDTQLTLLLDQVSTTVELLDHPATVAQRPALDKDASKN
jgi:hypothetical protein